MEHATLVVGNGFSIGFAHFLGVADNYKTSFLLPTDVPLERLPGSKLDAGPLWRRELFPELWDAWEGFGKVTDNPRQQFFDFCCDIAASKAITVKKDGVYSWTNRSVGAQMRNLLWFMFYHYDRMFVASMRRTNLHEWTWMHALKYLVRNFQL
ncbi:MAG TPA: hypothetical protein VGQ99_04095, partial [Tepidisphaeraceae bacterium]|nr:hypothetical protein [Tepidisphaeraceae bacterium]